MLAQSLGWTATFLFTICYLPQIIKTIRTKTVDGLSIWLFRIQFVANIVALCYATLIDQRPLQIKYTLALILLAVVLVVLARFGKNKAEDPVELNIRPANDLYQIKKEQGDLSTAEISRLSSPIRETLPPNSPVADSAFGLQRSGAKHRRN
jgi:MtN3 and saliva related transmembrane protein